MQTFKSTILLGLAVSFQLALHAQTTTKYLTLEKIIYHSSHCNGTCPVIDMEIDSNYNVCLHREIWTGKGEPDKYRSGNFKGKIDPHAYFNLSAALISSNYVNLKFPPIYCCDGAITTIIVYANGKRTRLSSMLPPREADQLIEFLHDLSLNLKIPPTSENLDLEQ